MDRTSLQSFIKTPLRRFAMLTALVTMAFTFFATTGAESVFAAGGTHRIYTGYVSSSAWINQSWHKASYTQADATALDIGRNLNPSGSSVRILSEHRGGSDYMRGYRFGLGTSTTCTGYEYRIRTPSAVYKGEERYVHIVPASGAPFSYTLAANSGFTALHVGTVAASQLTSCPWEVPHLHQADDLGDAGPSSKHGPFGYHSGVPYGGSGSWLFDYSW